MAKAGNTDIFSMQLYMNLLKMMLYKNGGKQRRGEILQGEMVVSNVNNARREGCIFSKCTIEGDSQIKIDDKDLQDFLNKFLPSEVSQWLHFYAKADYEHMFVDVAIQYLPKEGEKKGEFYQRRLNTVTSSMRAATRKLIKALPMPQALKERMLPAPPPAMEKYNTQ